MLYSKQVMDEVRLSPHWYNGLQGLPQTTWRKDNATSLSGQQASL